MQFELLLDLDVIPHLRLIFLQHHLIVLRWLIQRNKRRLRGGGIISTSSMRGHQRQASVVHTRLLYLWGLLALASPALLKFCHLLLLDEGIFLEAHIHEDLYRSLDILDQSARFCIP
jgi:hypothetical protein